MVVSKTNQAEVGPHELYHNRRGGPDKNGVPFFGSRVPFSVAQEPKNGSRIESTRRFSEHVFRLPAQERRKTARYPDRVPFGRVQRCSPLVHCPVPVNVLQQGEHPMNTTYSSTLSAWTGRLKQLWKPAGWRRKALGWLAAGVAG